MAIRKQAGFTLVELIVVMAITGLLAVIAFQGQRQLRSQAQFDAFVEKTIASIDNAHNQAIAGVNFSGDGDGSVDCGGAATPVGSKYIFAGVLWSATNGSPSVIQLDFYAARVNATTFARTGQTCIFNTETVSIIPGLAIDAPGASQRRIAFVRNDVGGSTVCRATSALPSLNNTFANGSCSPPAVPNASPGLTFTMSDLDGHSSSVRIDQSGLAKRLN